MTEEIEYDEDWEKYDGTNKIPILANKVFNLNTNETLIYYQYYNLFILDKYFLNEKILSPKAILLFGFIIFCVNNQYITLKDKVYLYFLKEVPENGLKTYLIFIISSYSDFLDGNLTIDENLVKKINDLEHVTCYDEDFYEYSTPKNINEEYDIFLNKHLFIISIISDKSFLRKIKFYSNSDIDDLNNKEILNWLLKHIETIPKKKYIKEEYINIMIDKIHLVLENRNSLFLIDEDDETDYIPF